MLRIPERKRFDGDRPDDSGMGGESMSYGDLLTYGGIAVAGISGIALIAGFIGFGIKRKKLRQKLFDRYGF